MLGINDKSEEIVTDIVSSGSWYTISDGDESDNNNDSGDLDGDISDSSEEIYCAESGVSEEKKYIYTEENMTS